MDIRKPSLNDKVAEAHRQTMCSTEALQQAFTACADTYNRWLALLEQNPANTLALANAAYHAGMCYHIGEMLSSPVAVDPRRTMASQMQRHLVAVACSN